MLCIANMNPKKLVQAIFTLCSNVFTLRSFFFKLSPEISVLLQITILDANAMYCKYESQEVSSGNIHFML